MSENACSSRQADLEGFRVRLRRYREEAGLSVRELAGRAGMTHSHYSDLERKGKKFPPFDEMMRLASVLAVDVLELAGCDGRNVQETRSLHSCSHSAERGQDEPVRVRHLERPPAMEHVNGPIADKREAEEYRVYLPPGSGKEDRFFSITMGDDRMEPLIQLGDTIVVDMEPTAETGKIVAATIDGERVAVRWIIDLNGLQVLKPERGASVLVDASVVLHGVVTQIVRHAP